MRINRVLSDKEILDEFLKYLDKKDIEEYEKQRELQGTVNLKLESLILTIGRPSFLIQNSTFDSSTSKIWDKRLKPNSFKIENIISSVGRIELQNHLSYDWIGTGWVVADNIIITNRHVAEVFVEKNNDKFSFKLSAKNKRIKGSIDFKEEFNNPEENEFDIVEILYIEDTPNADVAFFRIEASNRDSVILPKKINLFNEQINKKYSVVTIGYPAYDTRCDPELMQKIFNNIYDSKRISPGELFPSGEVEWLLKHDCSTLGGSSGSVIIDINTGLAVGIHFAGKYLESNYAVSSFKIIEIMKKLGIK